MHADADAVEWSGRVNAQLEHELSRESEAQKVRHRERDLEVDLIGQLGSEAILELRSHRALLAALALTVRARERDTVRARQ